MILLIKTSDNCLYYSTAFPSIFQLAKDKVSSYRQGFFLNETYSDDQIFPKEMLNTRKFIRIKINDEDFNEVWFSENRDDLCLRKYRLPLESILTEQELDDLKNGRMNEHDIIQLNDLSKIVVFDWKQLPAKFGIDW